MIDELNTELLIRPPLPVRQQTAKPFSFHGLKFIPQWHDTGYISYNSQLENLRIKIVFDKLYILNSWHKYYLKNNYSDYRLTDIKKTYTKLEYNLGECLEEAKVKRIAYGCVINENPYQLYPNWLYYKGKQPDTMTGKTGTRYGAKFKFTDFCLKGYDKTFEVWEHDRENIDENYFRLETEVKYMRHLHNRLEPINIFTPKDVFNPLILQQLSTDLMTKYRTIEKRPIMDLTGLSTHELNIIATMQNDTIRTHLKNEHNKTYKRYQKEFKTLTTGENAEFYNNVEDKIERKLSQLIMN